MTNKRTVSISTKASVTNMERIEYARWLCLIEAIDLVDRKAQELNTDLSSNDFWVKPLSFQKYIDQRLETMIIDIDREEFNMSVTASIQANKDMFKPVTEQKHPQESDSESDEVSDAVIEQMAMQLNQ